MDKVALPLPALASTTSQAWIVSTRKWKLRLNSDWKKNCANRCIYRDSLLGKTTLGAQLGGSLVACAPCLCVALKVSLCGSCVFLHGFMECVWAEVSVGLTACLSVFPDVLAVPSPSPVPPRYPHLACAYPRPESSVWLAILAQLKR